jgi:hypothetical protein
MTNRVWKKFLLKIAKFIGFVIVWFLTSVGMTYLLFKLGFDTDVSIVGGILGTLILLAILIILKLVYDDCKDEVARENRTMMRVLGDRN